MNGRVFVVKSVKLATRVCLEVMKAIAKKCSNMAEDMFIHGFTSRPVFQVKKRDVSGQLVLTYVDAIVRYGGRVKEGDLGLAYERAGIFFVGQMRQNLWFRLTKGQGREAGNRGSIS